MKAVVSGCGGNAKIDAGIIIGTPHQGPEFENPREPSNEDGFAPILNSLAQCEFILSTC